MQVLWLVSEFPPGPGGIGTHAYEITRRLAALGWEILVLTSQDYADEPQVEHFNATLTFPLVRFHRRATLLGRFGSRARILGASLGSFKPDVLVASGSRAVWLASLVPSGGVPRVAIGHGSEFAPPSPLARYLTRRSFSACDLVICVSEFTRSLMVKAGIRPARSCVIPNGADETRFRKIPPSEALPVRAKYGLPAGGRMLLTVGNVTPRKGQEVVIRALPAVLRSVPDAFYVMAGLPTLKPELIRLSQELGVADRVHFLGRVGQDELPLLMNTADLFLMTSRRLADGDVEGFGIAVVEAALCRKTAVVSGESGLAEAVTEGVTGICVRENDPEAVAVAVCRILIDPLLRARLETAAFDRATASMTFETVTPAYEQALHTLLRPGMISAGLSQASARSLSK